MNHELLQSALKIPGLKLFSVQTRWRARIGVTQRNLLIWCASAERTRWPAMVSANSLGAEAMRLADQIGTIAPGMQADIIALDGDPLQDSTAVRRVVFVMKDGVVYKNTARGRIPNHAEFQPWLRGAISLAPWLQPGVSEFRTCR